MKRLAVLTVALGLAFTGRVALTLAKIDSFNILELIGCRRRTRPDVPDKMRAQQKGSAAR